MTKTCTVYTYRTLHWVSLTKLLKEAPVSFNSSVDAPVDSLRYYDLDR